MAQRPIGPTATGPIAYARNRPLVANRLRQAALGSNPRSPTDGKEAVIWGLYIDHRVHV
jgi:hypothetical protein